MTLRMGLIGLGMMGRHHARVARQVEGVELVAVADALGDPHAAAGELPIHRTVDELLQVGIDMAIVAVPTRLHLEVGLALAEAGVHALIEKPVAHNLAAANALISAFESRALVGAVGHIERFNPALVSLRQRLQNGDLGQVYQIHTRRQGPFPARIADVGVVKDLGSHDFDLTSWLADSTYRQISAQTAHQSGRDHEDMVSITGIMESGVITSHLVNWLTPFKERITVVTGERGSFVADTISADLTYFENGTAPTTWDAIRAFRGVTEGSMTRFAIEKQEPLKSEHEAFRDLVLGKPSEAVTLQQGLQVLEVCEAALESARSQTTIRLSESK